MYHEMCQDTPNELTELHSLLGIGARHLFEDGANILDPCAGTDIPHERWEYVVKELAELFTRAQHGKTIINGRRLEVDTHGDVDFWRAIYVLSGIQNRKVCECRIAEAACVFRMLKEHKASPERLCKRALGFLRDIMKSINRQRTGPASWPGF